MRARRSLRPAKVRSKKEELRKRDGESVYFLCGYDKTRCLKVVVPILAFLSLAVSVSAADFTVTNTDSSGPGSLYQAITDANNTPGADRILFNIPGAGVHMIDVRQVPLPTVVESLVIDGYSQPGAKPNSLAVGDNAVILIQLDAANGISLGTASGLFLYPGSGESNYTVRGLCLTGFDNVAIVAGTVDSAVVTGNFIGVLPDGETARNNNIGVGHVTQLGGTDPAERNIISGNSVGFEGAASPFSEAPETGAVVHGNYFGTNASGNKAILNGVGIALESLSSHDDYACSRFREPEIDFSKTLIGGTAPGAGNLISGNAEGIRLGRAAFCVDRPSYVMAIRVNGVRIQGNSIGFQSDGSSALPNGHGISIVGSNNLVEGNAIAFNGTGVSVAGSQFGTNGNRISHNRIAYNRKLGIDLHGDGVTLNDDLDADEGGNRLQNYPVITSVSISRDTDGRSFATITGTLNSVPKSTFRLEFFNSAAAGPFGFGQGEVFLGSIDVTTDQDGNAFFTQEFETDPGRAVYTATATDSGGSTSEFSPAFPPAAQLLNLSTRGPVASGENVLIGGFTIGLEDKKVILRGLGPSLRQAGISGVLDDPLLELHDSKGALLASNDNWKETQEDDIKATGIAPADNHEAALLDTLPGRFPESESGGSYTAILSGKDGTAGIGLFEIYDLAPSSDTKLVNISARGFVGAGDALLIGGFIPGPDGHSPVRTLIRAVGPSLTGKRISAPLEDPILELHDANGNVIATNDNWSDAPNASEVAATGLAPAHDHESAILAVLPGNSGYTAVLRGVAGATGVALVEVYALN